MEVGRVNALDLDSDNPQQVRMTLASRRDLRVIARQTLPEFQLLLSEIRESVASLRQISRRLEDDLRRILYGPTLVMPGSGE